MTAEPTTDTTTDTSETRDLPDALDAAPDVHEVVVENDRVRVLAYEMEPGARTALHRHPANVVVHSGPACTLRFEDADGNAREVEVPHGYCAFDEAKGHVVENTDPEVTATGFIVELKG